jgi:hypothetical protein
MVSNVASGEYGFGSQAREPLLESPPKVTLSEDPSDKCDSLLAGGKVDQSSATREGSGCHMVVLYPGSGPRPQDVQRHPALGGVCRETSCKGLGG